MGTCREQSVTPASSPSRRALGSQGLCARQTVGLPPRCSREGLPWVCTSLSCAADTQSSPPAPSSPPQSENAHTCLADKTLLSRDTSKTLGSHLCPREQCDLTFFLGPTIRSLPPTPSGQEDASASAEGWTAAEGLPRRTPPGAALCPGAGAAGAPLWPHPHRDRTLQVPRPCRRFRHPGDSAAPAWSRSSAWRSWINQCLGLVFGYYGQYIKGIYLRKCLSCQSFPMSSILNTPYNYWYYPGKFSPWSFLH